MPPIVVTLHPIANNKGIPAPHATAKRAFPCRNRAKPCAYITDSEVEDWQSSIDIVLRRFTEYHDLEGAFGRRAVTERANGILMERHSVDEAQAFGLLRDQSRRTNLKLADIAAAVVDGHRLLPKQPRH